MKKTIVFFGIIFMIISCATQAKNNRTNKIPAWFENPKSVYPDRSYLTAIGSGDSRKDAEAMATANLSRIFKSEIKAEENIVQRYKEFTKNENTTIEDQTDVMKSVEIGSEQTLFNIQFAESFTDKMGRVQVLAYIDREKTAAIYLDKIRMNEDKILFFQKKSTEEKKLLKKYCLTNAANIIALNNNILIDQLGIISPGNSGNLQLEYDQSEIQNDLKETAAKISFNISIQNDTKEKITVIIRESMNDYGFVYNNDALLHFEGVLDISETDLNRQDDFKFVRYQLDLNVLDEQKSTIITFSDKGREGHVSIKEAEERAIRKLEKKLEKKLRNKLDDYFDSLIN